MISKTCLSPTKLKQSKKTFSNTSGRKAPVSSLMTKSALVNHSMSIELTTQRLRFVLIFLPRLVQHMLFIGYRAVMDWT